MLSRTASWPGGRGSAIIAALQEGRFARAPIMQALQPGTTRSEDIVPGPQHTASAVGNAGIDVVATTALILFIEEVSHGAVEQRLDPGEATVGVRVAVDHLAPARVGSSLRVCCELAEIRGRRLIFSCEVHQAGVLVMRGCHHRVVVVRDRFMAGAQAAG